MPESLLLLMRQQIDDSHHIMGRHILGKKHGCGNPRSQTSLDHISNHEIAVRPATQLDLSQKAR
jgi:hypothetical protein